MLDSVAKPKMAALFLFKYVSVYHTFTNIEAIKAVIQKPND